MNTFWRNTYTYVVYSTERTREGAESSFKNRSRRDTQEALCNFPLGRIIFQRVTFSAKVHRAVAVSFFGIRAVGTLESSSFYGKSLPPSFSPLPRLFIRFFFLHTFLSFHLSPFLVLPMRHIFSAMSLFLDH